MDDEQRETLQGLLSDAIIEHDMHGSFANTEVHEAKIYAYVDSLLAAKDAEIARLQARTYPQIEKALGEVELSLHVIGYPRIVMSLISALREAGIISEAYK